MLGRCKNQDRWSACEKRNHFAVLIFALRAQKPRDTIAVQRWAIKTGLADCARTWPNIPEGEL